jgi:hypothetical protein
MSSPTAATSSSPPPRRCAASWSRTHAGKSLKRGGDRRRVDLFADQHVAAVPDEELLALDEALDRFAGE